MFKKSLSVILCLVMVLSIFTVIPVSVFAEKADIAISGTNAVKTQTEAENWLKQQNGASYDFGQTFGDDGRWWNGTQCVEFVRAYVNWLVNGNAWTDAWNGPTYDGNTIWKNPLWSRLGWHVYENTVEFVPQPGDIFSAGQNKQIHTGVVISSTATTAVVAEANYGASDPHDGTPVVVHQITWGPYLADNGHSPHHFIRPNFASTPTPSDFEPVIIGNDVLVTITNAKGVMCLAGTSSNNAIIESKSDSDAQKWRFQRQSDDTYKITNVAYGKCLDVTNGNTGSGTNIGIYTDNGTDSQRFFIREAKDGFALVPKLNKGLAVDIVGGNLTSGNNIQDYTWNNSNAQTFTIDPYGLAPSATTTSNGHTYEYYSTGLPWTVAYRFCESKGGHLATITSSDENSVVYNLCKGRINVVWLGGTAFNNSRKWYWITGESFSYAPWHSGEPNNTNGNEDFLTMWIDEDTAGTWNDARNNSQGYNKVRGFVCEYDNGNVSGSYSPSATVTKNGIKYEVYDSKVDWQSATKICKAKGGKLARIDSASKNAIVAEVAASGSSNEYWIDATDRRSEAIWEYGDGSRLSYTNWLSGEPNNDTGLEQYAAFQKADGKWIDLKSFSPVYRKTGFICEYDIPKPGKPSFTKFDLHNWSDGSFGWLDLAWTATSNTTAYGIHIYNYNTGAEVKKYSYNDPNCTTARLSYNDVLPGRYKVQIKSYNAYGSTAGDIREAVFVEQSTPTSAWVKATPATIPVGGSTTFTFDGENCTSATNFYLTVKKGNTIFFDGSVNLERKTGKTLTFDTEGTYTAFVKAQLNGSVLSDTITFYVFEPVTLGSDFKANMLNAVYSNTQRVLTGNGENVIVSNKLQNKDEEKWHFELQSDKTYKITNLKNGKCLDITDGTVKLASDNGSDDQRFYAVYHFFGFIMVSKSTGLAIDMKDGSVKLNPYDPSANNVGQPFSVDGYFDTKPYKTMTYNGHTYELYLVRMPWNQAERFCEHKGGHLVTITSAEEQEKVYGMCKNSGYAVWLGGSDLGREGEWYWITGEKFTYSNWHTGRPTSSTNNNYAALYAYDSDDWGHGIWNDWSNIQRISSTQMYTICEYDNGDVNADAYKPAKTVEHNGIKYEVFDENVDWVTAEAICAAKGGHLVLIDSAELNDFVSGIIADGKMNEYWINGTDRINEGIWTDHTGKKLNYLKWDEYSPQNDFDMADYAVIKKDGIWRDQKNINCIRKGTIGFICEYTPEPKAIKLNKDDISLETGKTYQLTATVTPAKADQTVTWRSSKPSIATVDQNGKVKGVSEGTAIIYATTVNGLQAPCVVTVTAAPKAILGDVDGDDEVTILDATAIQRHLASLPTQSYNATAADADKDGEVTILDATAIQRHLASLPTQAKDIGKPLA